MQHQRNEQIPFGLLVNKWTFPVVGVLRQNTMRYNAIEKAIPNITQKSLTDTLRKLERNGMLDRYVYPTVPPQVEYKLTPLGLDLLKLSGVLSDWVDIHEYEIKRAQKSYDRRNKS